MLIFHGDDNIASRQAALDAKADGLKKGQNILEYSGSELPLSELVTKAESVSLLGESNLLVITDFFVRRTGKDKKAINDYLKQHPDLSAIFWEGKDVSVLLSGFPVSTIKKFDLPVYIFKFLDHFSLDLLSDTLKNTPPEQLLALLGRRIRDLILVKHKLLVGPEWKARQLAFQAEKYPLLKLLKMYSGLLDIDYLQKNSLSPYNLHTALELWVVNALR